MVSSACADANDFQLSAGKLQLLPHTLRSATANFIRTLDGANGVQEEITEIPRLAVTVPGLYVVAWDIHGNANNTPAAPPTAVATNIIGAVGKNGVVQVGTETSVIVNSQATTTTAQPGYQIHATGSGTEFMNLVAGDELSLFAARAADAGTTCEIQSNPTGRTRLRAWRLGPS